MESEINNVGKLDPGWETQEWKLRTLTPIWAGGVEREKDGKSRCADPMKGSGLVGSLRYSAEQICRQAGLYVCSGEKWCGEIRYPQRTSEKRSQELARATEHREFVATYIDYLKEKLDKNERAKTALFIDLVKQEDTETKLRVGNPRLNLYEFIKQYKAGRLERFQEQHCAVCEIFGSTEKSRAFQIQINDLNYDEKRKGLFSNEFRIEIWTRKNEPRGATAHKLVDDAIQLFATTGGFGARTQHGWGQVELL